MASPRLNPADAFDLLRRASHFAEGAKSFFEKTPHYFSAAKQNIVSAYSSGVKANYGKLKNRYDSLSPQKQDLVKRIVTSLAIATAFATIGASPYLVAGLGIGLYLAKREGHIPKQLEAITDKIIDGAAAYLGVSLVSSAVIGTVMTGVKLAALGGTGYLGYKGYQHFNQENQQPIPEAI
jgi:hypothetical protein